MSHHNSKREHIGKYKIIGQIILYFLPNQTGFHSFLSPYAATFFATHIPLDNYYYSIFMNQCQVFFKNFLKNFSIVLYLKLFKYSKFFSFIGFPKNFCSILCVSSSIKLQNSIANSTGI